VGAACAAHGVEVQISVVEMTVVAVMVAAHGAAIESMMREALVEIGTVIAG
jgi:hypothetical protein